ncbi:type II toxin-antitoxin system MqsA family antitoxin [Bordetella avium]|uniref:type II toxin-antitoxin system MqsA family antitoxin n=1 Tax=Bordetella avium TaxID=521 RepID=UPI002174FB73|nr:type II toxin-antitoxin system MqsA family antitoxin [Bordetella avium]
MHDTCDLPATYEGGTTVISAVMGDFCPACGEVFWEWTNRYAPLNGYCSSINR